MADKGAKKASTHDLVAPGPDRIRNVVLVGPSASGKTTLAETLLVTSGAITRAGTVADGSTVTDYEETEHLRGRGARRTASR